VSKGNVFAAWLLFVLLPVILSGWCFSRASGLIRNSELREALFNLSQEARAIIGRSNPVAFSRERFNAETRHQSSSGTMEIEYQSGDPACLYPEFRELADYFAGGSYPDAATVSRWRLRFGWEFDPVSARDKPSFPIPVRWNRESAWLIWEKGILSATLNFGKESVAVRLAVYIPPSPFCLLSRSLDKYLHIKGGMGAAVDLKNRSFKATPGISKDKLKKVLLLSKKRNIVTQDQSTYASFFEVLPGDVGLYLERRLPGNAPDENETKIWLLTAVILISLTLIFPTIRRESPSWSLKAKLFGIFSYVVVFPLFSVGLLTMGVLEDRRRTNEQEILQSAREAMMELDEGFKEEERLNEIKFRGILTHPDLKAGRFDEFAEKMNKWMERGFVDRIIVWDWKGARRVFLSRTQADPGYDRINEMHADRVVKENHGTFDPTKMPSQKVMMWSILETPEMGYLEFLRKPRILHKFTFGQSLFYGFWDAASNVSAGKAAFITLNQSHRSAALNYLKKKLVRNRSFPIFARDRQTGRWYPKSLKSNEMESLCDEVSRSSEDQIGRLNKKGTTYFVLGISGFRLDRFDLVALIPEEKLHLDVTDLKRFVAIGMILALVVGVACAIFLVNGLLLPIGDITLGIDSLRSRNFKYRIPLRGDDEMAKLSHAFNHMIETMGEIDTAKVVQESMIPRLPPPPPGYEIGIKCKMTSAIGGDYLDCFIINKRKMGFLVGDVSGHGVSAALVMAMAKTVVFNHFREGRPESELLVRLDLALYDLTLPQQMMTFCFGVIDVETHECSLTVAGNPLPYHWIAAEKRSRLIGNIRYPLGIIRNQLFKPFLFTMEKGDSLLLYTDGIIEALDPSGNPFGYERLQGIIDANGGKDSDSLIQIIDEALIGHIKNCPMSDDASFINIRRCATPRGGCIA